MGRYTVAYEGRPTADNRLFEVGSLSPRSVRLPVLFEFRHDMDSMGTAEDFQSLVNAETGFTEVSFEIYFKGDWETRVRNAKLTPTCALIGAVERTPYDKPEALALERSIITSAQITAIGFTRGANAWAEIAK
jgi:hypothetical protein